MKITDQNCIQEEIKITMNSWNSSYRSVQNLLPCSLMFKDVNIFKTVILPPVLYGCETWSFILGKEHRLKV